MGLPLDGFLGKQLWKFNHERKIQLRCSDFQPSPKQRHGDSCIIDKVLELEELYQESIILFDRVSKWKQVILWSDIAT